MTVNLVKSGGHIDRTNNDLKSERNQQKGQEAQSSSVATRKTDTLELSDAAKKIQTVRAKIDQNFYDKPEILRQTVDRLYEDILNKEATGE